jgi:hypothetical protein
MHKVTIVCAMLLLIAGCASKQLPTLNVGVSYARDFCAVAQPIYWASAADVKATPDGIVRAVVVHNEVGAKLCGWGEPAAAKPAPAKNQG